MSERTWTVVRVTWLCKRTGPFLVWVSVVWGDTVYPTSSSSGVCSGSLSPVGITTYEKCCYVCVMEMCLCRRVLCIPFWSRWCPFQSGLQWFLIVDTSGCEGLPYRVLCTPHHVSPTVAEGILCVGTERRNTGRRDLVRIAGNDWLWAGCWKTLMIVSEI